MLYGIATTMLQLHLDRSWEIVDAGNPTDEVIAWLREGGHKSIDDHAAKMVADLMAKNRRRVEQS